MVDPLLQDLNKWEADRRGLAEKLRTRLVELDRERQFVLEKLRDVDAQRQAGPGTGAIRSSVGKAVLAVLEQAGEAGLPARDVTVRVRALLKDPEVPHDLIATHLSRLKRRGLLTSLGDARSMRYVFLRGGVA